MNNSPAYFGWGTSDNLRDYPKTRKKAWKSSEEMAGAIPAISRGLQKSMSLPEKLALLAGFSFVSFLVRNAR
jgi:hypothetical protein